MRYRFSTLTLIINLDSLNLQAYIWFDLQHKNTLSNVNQWLDVAVAYLPVYAIAHLSADWKLQKLIT